MYFFFFFFSFKDLSAVAAIPTNNDDQAEDETFSVIQNPSQDEGQKSNTGTGTSVNNAKSPNVENAPKDEPPKKLKKKTPPKGKGRFDNAISKLHEIAKMTNVAETEDQYSQFGQHVALQLRELPIRSFVTLQEKIQSLITQERLRIMDMSMTQPSPSVVVHQPFHTGTATNDYVSPPVIKMNVEGNSYCSAADSLQQQATFFHM